MVSLSQRERTQLTEGNLDEYLPLITTQGTSLTKSQVSFNKPKCATQFILNKQKELDNMHPKIMVLKSFFMDDGWVLQSKARTFIHSSNRNKKINQSRNNDCVKEMRGLMKS